MKTLKLAMVAVLIACAMISVASTDGGKIIAKKIVNCSFEKAVTDPGLRLAMYQQLDPNFLKNEQLVYTVTVNYNATIYRITGTRAQWVKFFTPKIKMESKPVFSTSHE
jgi:hypothetical protein